MKRFWALNSLFIPILLLSQTYHPIVIDGENDFTEKEAIIIDRPDDSYWGAQNELDTLFLTWTQETLYVGCAYRLNNNALLIFLDTGPGGIDNANELDWYPRDVRFSGVKPDYLIALWNCDLSFGGVRKLGTYTTAIPFNGLNSGSPGGNNFLEVAIPMEALGNPEKIRLTCVLCGGDYSGAGDVMPDDPSVRGSGSAIINIFTGITIDADADGIPDSSVIPVEEISVDTFPVIFPTFSKVEVTPDIASTGPVHISVELTDTSKVFVSLFNENGRFIRNIIDGVETMLLEYDWDISDLPSGIYILKFYTSENRGMVKKAFVRW